MKKGFLSKKAIITLASVGGALEMYDFVIYIFFAGIIAKLFFPMESRYAAMLSTFAVFASGYLFRPIGGILFGHLGDRYGRQKGLLISIIAMGFSVLMMALMPTYAQIGIAAPILFCFFRLVQGIALGGDLPGAITFVNEYANNHERGLMTGFLFLSINVGIMLASFVGMLCTNFLSAQAAIAWGWRAAFLLGMVLFVVGYYFRSKNVETPIFQALLQKRKQFKIPFIKLFLLSPLNVVRGIALTALQGVLIVQLFLYMPIYLTHVVHIDSDMATLFNTINLCVFSLCIPLVGFLSDRLGRKLFLMIAGILFLTLSFPLYWFIASGNIIMVWTGLLVFALISACAVGVIPATLPELFPTSIRNTGVGISYNLGFGIFGGLSPIVATALLHHFKNPIAPGINLVVVALMMLLFLLPMTLPKNKSLS